MRQSKRVTLLAAGIAAATLAAPALGAGQVRGAGLRLTAQFDVCDGFFVARLERL